MLWESDLFRIDSFIVQKGNRLFHLVQLYRSEKKKKSDIIQFPYFHQYQWNYAQIHGL